MTSMMLDSKPLRQSEGFLFYISGKHTKPGTGPLVFALLAPSDSVSICTAVDQLCSSTSFAALRDFNSVSSSRSLSLSPSMSDSLKSSTEKFYPSIARQLQ